MTDLDKVKAHYAEAWGCDVALFDGGNHVVEGEDFEMVGFGHGTVVRALPEIAAWCRERFAQMPPEFLFDGEHVYALDVKLRRRGLMLRGTSTHYLLREARPHPLPEGLDYRLLTRPAVNALQPGGAFPFAFNGDGSDVIALTAEHDGRLVALASADDRWGELWQIGIQVLPEARLNGLARGLVARVTQETVARGKTPFYSTWAGNMGSTRTALGCGYVPAWLSMDARPLEP